MTGPVPIASASSSRRPNPTSCATAAVRTGAWSTAGAPSRAACAMLFRAVPLVAPAEPSSSACRIPSGFRRMVFARCRTIASPCCCSRWTTPSCSMPWSPRPTGGSSRSRSSSRVPNRSGSGAPSRCPERSCTIAPAVVERDQRDEYLGTLLNAYIGRGGQAYGVCAGEAYVDVGTLNGYREAIQLLNTDECGRPGPRTWARALAGAAPQSE